MSCMAVFCTENASFNAIVKNHLLTTAAVMNQLPKKILIVNSFVYNKTYSERLQIQCYIK